MKHIAKVKWGFLLLTTYLVVCGCSRAIYREQADRQVEEILAEKVTDQRWHLPDTSIQPDATSRFFNEQDPDCPPLPPGDTVADEIMFNPSGMRGAKLWQSLAKLDSLESSAWRAYFNLPNENPEQGFDVGNLENPKIEKLSLAEAVELSLVHSREYQQQLENLYLSALALSFERYRFQVRPLGIDGLNPGSQLGYRNGPNGASNFELGDTVIGFSRLFPTGAQMKARLSNLPEGPFDYRSFVCAGRHRLLRFIVSHHTI